MKTIRTKMIWMIVTIAGVLMIGGCGNSVVKSLFPWEDGLIAYYNFDGNVNAINGDDAKASGGPKYIKTNSSLNEAIQLDGVDDYIELPKQDHLLNSDFTVLLWVKFSPQTNAFGYAALFIQSTNPNLPWDGVSMFADSQISARLDAANVLHSSYNNIDDNKWHCVAFVKKGNVLKLYIDGKYDNMISATHTKIANKSPIFIGANHIDHTKQLYKGAIDELRIYDRALKESTIKTIYDLNLKNLFQ